MSRSVGSGWNAPAFATIDAMDGIAALAAFVGAGLPLILSLFGLWQATGSRPQQTVVCTAGMGTHRGRQPVGDGRRTARRSFVVTGSLSTPSLHPPGR